MKKSKILDKCTESIIPILLKVFCKVAPPEVQRAIWLMNYMACHDEDHGGILWNAWKPIAEINLRDGVTVNYTCMVEQIVAQHLSGELLNATTRN